MTRSGKTPMRLLCLVLTLLCLLNLAQPMQAAAADPALAEAPEQLRTTAVHRYGSYSSSVIGRMEDGTAVTVRKETNGFYQIDCYDMTGYIAKSQVAKAEDGTYYISCDPTSSETKLLDALEVGEAISLRHSILALGKRYIGVSYVYGGMSPRGFDCSGFTKYVYGKLGMTLTRRASTQLADGIVVSKDSLQVGDLIFLRYSYDRYPASHVGIYAGGGKVLHASSSRGIVLDDLDGIFFSQNYLCARRIINTAAADIEADTALSVSLERTRTPGLRSIGG